MMPELSVLLRARDELTPALQNAAKQANQVVADMQTQLSSAGKAMTNAGKTLSLGVTAPLVAGGAAAFKLGADFDTAFREVNTMLRATADEQAAYKAGILEISSATGIAATDVVDAYYQIVSAGYRGADSLDILDTAMRGATGGAADATATTQALTKAMNIFELTGADGATQAMDTFFGIVDSGLLSFGEMASAFPRASSNAAGLGVSIEEAGAMLATLSKVLGSTDQAATATDAVFRSLISPSEELAALYEEWGVSSGPEAIDKYGGVTGVLDELERATGGQVTAIKDLFASDEAMRGALPLLTSSYDDFHAALETVAGSTGRTGENFDELTAGPGFQMQQSATLITNALIALGAELDSVLGPIIEDVTGLIKDAASWFGKLPEPVQRGAIVAGLLAAALGPVLMGIGLMTQGLGVAIGLLNGAAAATIVHQGASILAAIAMKGVTAAQWLLNAALTANPIGIVLVAVGLLVAALVLLWQNNETVREKLTAAWNAIKDFFVDVWDRITGLFKGGMDAVRGFVMAPIDWVKDLSKHWDAIKEAMLGPIMAAYEKIKKVVGWIKDLLAPLSGGAEEGMTAGIAAGSYAQDYLRKQQLNLVPFAAGGMITEPTLLYGLRSQRPYAIAGEAGPEAVVPGGMGGNVTINVATLHVREEADIGRIARELYRMQSLRAHYA